MTNMRAQFCRAASDGNGAVFGLAAFGRPTGRSCPSCLCDPTACFRPNIVRLQGCVWLRHPPPRGAVIAPR